MTEHAVAPNGSPVEVGPAEPTKKPRKQRSDKGQRRTKPYNLKKNKETTNV